ncbi:MAG: hypothetical protein DRP56_00610 [Planctomycetota bacterium]|nr:MAG: hypothetical protein DRP56_00610 [Planctomycetota bacterium]
MKRVWKYTLIIILVIGFNFCTSMLKAEDAESDLLNFVKAGVRNSEDLINNISFNYFVDYDVSSRWREVKLAEIQERNSSKLPSGIELRVPTLEHKLHTGSALFEGSKFNIKRKQISSSDQEIFEDEIVVSDGLILTELKLKENHGYLSNSINARRADLMFDPRNFPLLFLDGKSLSSALMDTNTTCVLTGSEEIQGAMCHVIEMLMTFETPGEGQKQVKRKCWIAPDKGFLIKKGISFQVDAPDKIFSTVECNLKEIAGGLWYYSDVTFQSFPMSTQEPDVFAALGLSDIVINQDLGDEAFVADISKVQTIYDTIAEIQYNTKTPLPEVE